MKLLTTILFGLYLLIVLVAGWIAPDYYSVSRNTLSELAAQGFPHAWLMRSGFFIFAGAIICLGFLQSKMRKMNLLQTSALLFLLLYGGTVFTTGLWCEKNFFILDHNLESFIHHFFLRYSSLFFLLAVWTNALAQKKRSFSIASIITFFAFAGLSGFFAQFDDYQGLSQRGMHFVSLLWLTYLNAQKQDVPAVHEI